MREIVLLTHPGLGTAFVAVLRHIYGTVPKSIQVLEVGPNTDLVAAKALLRSQIEALGTEHQWIILSDIVGATPTNLVPEEASEDRVLLITGLNLPLLLRTLSRRDAAWEGLPEALIEGGRDGIDRYYPRGKVANPTS